MNTHCPVAKLRISKPPNSKQKSLMATAAKPTIISSRDTEKLKCRDKIEITLNGVYSCELTPQALEAEAASGKQP